MNFFEQELRKIVGPRCPDAAYVGRACYVRLNEMNRAKIQLVTCGTADRYEALQMTILNRNDGQVDSLRLRFADIWGKGQVSNLYIQQNGPYAWTYNGKTEWYAYHPNAGDYQKLTDAVCGYLEVFQEQAQQETPSQQWTQTM